MLSFFFDPFKNLAYCREQMKNRIGDQCSDGQAKKHPQHIVESPQTDCVGKGNKEYGHNGAEADYEDSQGPVSVCCKG